MASLRVNDMLIAVNGKGVGGMTTTGVEIELEVSGPDLVLLVSRYKFADEIRESIHQAEQAYLQTVDAVINDDRLLGWTDICSWYPSAIVPNERNACQDGSFIGRIDKMSQNVAANEASTVNQELDGSSSVQSSRPNALNERGRGHEIDSTRKGLPDAGGMGNASAQLMCELEANGYGSDTGSPAYKAFGDRLLDEERVGLCASISADFREPTDVEAIQPKESSPRIIQSERSKNELVPAGSGVEALRSFRLSTEYCGVVEETDKFMANEHLEHVCPGRADEIPDSESEVSEAIGEVAETVQRLPVARGHQEGRAVERQSDASSDRDSEVFANQECCSESEHDSITDDGNAWCACVCGEVHKKRGVHKEIFWIQCECCQTWYDSSSRCLGFSQRRAESVYWTCWGCPEEKACQPESQGTDASTGSKPQRVSSSPIRTEKGRCNSRSPARKKRKNEKGDRSQSGGAARISVYPLVKSERVHEVFAEADLVFVDEHAWPGVNNPEGIAEVLKAYIDDDGDQVYDIRYIVGGKRKGVLTEHLRRHVFD
jgi:hypothetical protein